MDISMLLGWIIAIALIISGITMPKLGNFWDAPSALIVVGGTIAALIACYPFRIIKEIPKHIGICFRGGKKYNVPQTVDALVDLALIARQSGLLALEEKAEEVRKTLKAVKEWEILEEIKEGEWHAFICKKKA